MTSPNRTIAALLADPSHTLPMPDRGGRPFSKGGELVDGADPFWMARFADGSIIRGTRQVETPAPAIAAEAASAGSDAPLPSPLAGEGGLAKRGRVRGDST
jgi:hypothetical protein